MKKQQKKPKTPKHLPQSRVKINFRRHVLPPLAGLLVAIAIFGFFNSQIISGKIAYYVYSRHISVSNLDETTAAAPIATDGPDQVIINKINITAPVVYDQTVVDEKSFQRALEKGVVHYPGTALPGEAGNVVIFGHSSDQWWAPGDFRYVFSLLDKLIINDRIFIDYKGVRYIYKVTETSIVQPDDLSVLVQGSNNVLTLITCSPVGSNQKRLIIRAEQIEPVVAPDTASTAAAKLPEQTTNKLPSHTSSFWDKFLELF